MKQLNVAVLASILFSVVAAICSAQTVGLYFDPNGLRSSYTSSTLSYPVQLDAYLIAKDYDSTTGVMGWECALTWTDSLFVNVVEIYGQAINVGTAPSFIVGQSITLGVGTDLAVLAKFSVVALGGGDLSLGASVPSSVATCNLPVLLAGDSLIPCGPEFGTPGGVCASIGHDIEPIEGSGNAVLTSQFTELEFRGTELYGLLPTDKSWHQLPSFRHGDPVVLTREQMVMLALKRTRSAFPTSPQKSQVIFTDDFERYAPNANSPFQLQYGSPYGQFVTQSGDNSSETYGHASLWGVTNAKAFGGTRSAYCNAVHAVCSDYLNWTGCAFSYNSVHELEDYRYTQLMTDWMHLNDTSSKLFSCKVWTDMDGCGQSPESCDNMRIVMYALINDQIWDYPIATIWWNSDWDQIDYPLPTGLPAGTYVFFGFDFVTPGGSRGGVGVYVDDVKLESFDVDLSIANAYPLATVVEDIDLPNVVRVEIHNEGTTDSEPCTLAYSRGTMADPDAFEGVSSVPAIPANTTAFVDVEVPFKGSSKTWAEDINQSVHFYVNPDQSAPEVHYNNNGPRTVSITWRVPIAPVILVHGMMGGALKKGVNGQVFGEDFWTNVKSLVFDSDPILRSTDTNAEADGVPMYVPSAFPPGNGFIRNVTLFPFLRTPNGGVGGAGQALFPLPAMSGYWAPILEDLTNGIGAHVLPAAEPSQTGPHEQDVFLFNYDWRLDLNPTRAADGATPQLNGSRPTYARLDSLVTWIRDNHPGADRLTIVSHSMGGLVVEAYLRASPTSHGIARWISMGSPFQGSETIMALLLGERSALGSMGMLSGDNLGIACRGYVSAWELLPTPLSDAISTGVSGMWNGPKPYSYSQLVCPEPCLECPKPVTGNVSIADLKAHPSNYGTWYDNQSARQHATAFQSTYMNMSAASAISGVDTWIIAGANEASDCRTVRGVARYVRDLQPTWIDPRVPNAADYRRDCTEIIAGPGDGRVSVWSATTVNVNESDLQVRYAAGVRHDDLIRNDTIGGFVADLIRDRDLMRYDNSLVRDNPLSGVSPDRISIRWHTDAAMWTDKVGQKTMDIAGMPVTMELYERMDGDPQHDRLLVGLMHPSPPIGDAGDVQSSPIVLDPSLTYSRFDDDLEISVPSGNSRNLRLVIRPSATFDDPAAVPTAQADAKVNAGFIILGHLTLVAQGRVFVFPAEYLFGNEYLSFYGPGQFHFGAAMDFTVQNGAILELHNLMLAVDSDGDGYPEHQVSTVDDTDLIPEFSANRIGCAPNPFNIGASIDWEIAGGDAGNLCIYDVSGRRVRTYILDGGVSGVRYFDGRDDSGRILASGTYIANVTAPDGAILASTLITLMK